MLGRLREPLYLVHVLGDVDIELLMLGDHKLLLHTPIVGLLHEPPL